MELKRSSTLWMLAIIALAVLLVAGCSKDVTRISRILENPDKYMGDEVKIAGEVVDVKSVNLLIAEPGLYRVDDGTGMIWVMSSNGVPRVGREVGLRGIVRSPLNIMGDHFGAFIKETERRTR